MFELLAPDNDLYFFRGRLDVTRCVSCGELTKKWEEDLSSVPIPDRGSYDVSYSYDGVLVVSTRFREVVELEGIAGVEFRPLQAGLFSAASVTVVPFDAKARETRFENRCPNCRRYESVVGATPVFLMPGAVVPDDGVVRTDLEFGSGDEKTPVLLCGDEAAKRLRGHKLRGLTLETVK
jgi:hypothetical protein